MKVKKAIVYFISFFSLSIMFSICYYVSYKNALRQFNESAVERNNELILFLENRNLLTDISENENTVSDNKEEEISNTEPGEQTALVNTVPDTVLPNTKYRLQVYDMKHGTMEEDTLPPPSYLIGLKREEILEYLHEYMQDLPLSEFEKGLVSFELISFSKDDILLRKTYNADKVENRYFLKTQNGHIVVYYGDKKTVYDYTSLSTERLSQYEKMKLEEGIFAKDLDELYALLENYSS